MILKPVYYMRFVNLKSKYSPNCISCDNIISINKLFAFICLTHFKYCTIKIFENVLVKIFDSLDAIVYLNINVASILESETWIIRYNPSITKAESVFSIRQFFVSVHVERKSTINNIFSPTNCHGYFFYTHCPSCIES